jgi:predicted cobalt transporter CbtA
MAVAGIMALATHLNDGKEPAESVQKGLLVVGSVVAVVVGIRMILGGDLFDYNGTDGIARGLFAVIGLAALGLGAYLWHSTGKPQSS